MRNEVLFNLSENIKFQMVMGWQLEVWNYKWLNAEKWNSNYEVGGVLIRISVFFKKIIEWFFYVDTLWIIMEFGGNLIDCKLHKDICHTLHCIMVRLEIEEFKLGSTILGLGDTMKLDHMGTGDI